MRLISEADVQHLINPREAIDIAADAFVRQSTGSEPAPGRLDLRRPQPKAGMLILSGYSGAGMGIVKSNMHVYLGTPAQRKTASLLALWDMEQCVPLALISSAAFNGHRTASGFAAAVRALARPDASRLAIFGAGHMAAPAIAYMKAVRPIRHVTITSRRHEQAHLFAQCMADGGKNPGVTFEAVADRDAAAVSADIIVCVTSSDEPVFSGRVVRAGTCVVLGGANRPGAREADDDLARRAVFYCDHRAGCLEKAGDVRIPLAGGIIADDAADDIGPLLAGKAAARGEIPVFKSIGIAPQDLALASYVVGKANAAGVGTAYDPLTGQIREARS
jgi:ornithine cyclodeaminase